MLPRFENKAYYIFEKGEHFGHIDIAGDLTFVDIDNTQAKKSQITLDVIRQFTA